MQTRLVTETPSSDEEDICGFLADGKTWAINYWEIRSGAGLLFMEASF